MRSIIKSLGLSVLVTLLLGTFLVAAAQAAPPRRMIAPVSNRRVIMPTAIVPLSNGRVQTPSVYVAPSTAGLINPGFLVAPGLSLNQYAYNVRTLGAAYSSVPPYLFGYNPYPQIANYGSVYPSYNPYSMYQNSFYPPAYGYGNPGYGYPAYGSNLYNYVFSDY